MKILLTLTLSLFIAAPYIAAQESPLEFKLSGISAAVLSMAFSPDDKTLVVGCRDGTTQLFDLESRQIQVTRPSKGDQILQVSFSHNGESIAVATSNDKLILWDRNLSKELFSVTQPKITCFSFDSTSQYMLIGRWNAALEIFDVKRQVNVKTIREVVTTRSVDWSRDGKLMACGSWGDNVEVFDSTTYKEVLRLGRFRKYHPPVAFSPDSNMLAVGGTGDQEDRGNPSEVLLWDLKERKEHTRLKVRSLGPIGQEASQVTHVAFCPNGKLLAASDFEHTRVWDLATKTVISVFPQQTAPETFGDQSMAFSHDGKYLTLSADKDVGLWRLPYPR